MTVKLIFCLHRLPGMSRAEFQSYWHDQHAPLVRRHAAALGITRYVQSHSFVLPALQAVLAARGAQVDDYDGVAEISYASQQALEAMRGDVAARGAGRELLEDERRFIDLARSPIFFTHEQVIIAG